MIRATQEFPSHPEFTPKIVQWLLWATITLSIGVSLIDPILIKYFNFTLSSLLGLSYFGANHFYLWQPLTYLFLQSPTTGITFGWIIILAFQLYLLWIIGSDIANTYTTGSFLTFYFLSGILAGIAGWITLILTNDFSIYGGGTAVLFALFAIWTMMHPTRELLFFFLFRIALKQLFGWLFLALILISLTHADFLSISLSLTACLTAYFYGIIVWGLHSPYTFTRPLDNLIFKLRQKKRSGKIIDIRTGQSIEKENAFIDACLEKISKKGKNALSWWERIKLNRIITRRNKK